MISLSPFSIDTRTIQTGDIFVALDGAKQKGYSFLAEAFQKGAASAFCASTYQREVPAELLSRVRFVENPAEEMARLAREYRKQLSIPVVGVAGSVGKTSTKQFLSYLLSRKLKTLATTGNLNNHLGLPMMLSRIRPEHQVAVLEMGADHVGDLANLVKIAEPTLGLLTPIAPEHLLGFGSLAGVYDGELELLLSPRLKTLVTVDSDAELNRRLAGKNLKVIRVGLTGAADIQISNIRVENARTYLQIQGVEIILPTAAAFLALNAGLAVAMALELGFSLKDVSGEWFPDMPKGRFGLRKIAGDLTVIDDTYNSSPKAFSAAIESLHELKFSRKWLVFSDMLELGHESENWHRQLAEDIARSDLFAAFAFGKDAKTTIETLRSAKSRVDGKWFESPDQLTAVLKEQVRPGDLILFKGSRGMRVERVLEALEA